MRGRPFNAPKGIDSGGSARGPCDTVVATRGAATDDLPDWLRGDPIAAHLRSLGRPVTKAAWLECAYGSSNEVVLEHDKETREWVRRHFPADPHEPVS